MEKKKPIKKKYILSGVVLVLGLILSLYLVAKERNEKRIGEDMSIAKNEWKDGELNLDLIAHFNDDNEDFSLKLEEREYTEKEFEEKYIEFLNGMGDLILGENKSFLEISKDVILKNTYENYPFAIHWESSDEEIIDKTGHLINNRDTDESFDITLFGSCIYKSYRRTFEVRLRVIPAQMSERDRFVYRLERLLLEESSKDPTQKTIILPNSLDGIKLSWTEKNSLLGIWVLVITVFVSILIQFACDYDEKKKDKRKEELLRTEYPSFVEKLRLYVLSGMTIKNAFLEIAKNEEVRNEGGKYLGRRLKEAKNKLQNGIAEEKVYDEFAASCSEEYRKLSFILTIALKQGNDRIIEVLEEEAREAGIYRNRMCKKKADELGVKLLFPMMVMLILVMGLIMVPAYLGFG